MKYTGEISITNKSAEEAVIDIEGVIGIPEWWQFDDPDEKIATYDKFKQKVNEIKNLSVKKLTVNIRSLGGSVNDAMLIHDTLVGLNAKVTTNCYGYTASSATIIAQAGSKGNRKISSNSLYLIHQAATYTSGNINNIKEAVQILEKTNERIASLYSARGDKPTDFYIEIMNRANGNGEWLSPDEVLAAALADEIIHSVSITNFDTSEVVNMKLPDIPENKVINISNTNTNQKIENMKFKIQDGWKFIQNFFNWNSGEEKEMSTENLQALNDECTKLETENISQKNAITNLNNEMVKKDTEILRLTDQVTNLEGEIEKLKANATQTEDQEDPDITGEHKKGNAAAYDADVKNLK